ncbi:MAG: TldD/PmbA family protein [Acidimicrobiales bacterium]
MSGEASPAAGWREGELAALAERWVGEAAPGEALEVALARSVSTTVRAYEGEVESFTSAQSYGVGVRVIAQGRLGFAHAGSFDDDVIAEALAAARDNARFAEPDEWNGLVEPDGVAQAALELWRPEALLVPVADKVELALALERAVRGADPRIKGVRTAAYSDSAGQTAIASSAGIRSETRSTSAFVSVNALGEENGETTSGYGVDAARDPASLSIEKAAEEAVRQAVRLLGAGQAPSQRVHLLLEPKLAATVLGIVAGTLTASMVQKNRSPFADRLGHDIASPLLSLVDDPTDPASFGADPFDGEGLATRANPLVRGGVLTGFLHNSYTARRGGVRSTASAVRSARSTPEVGVQALAAAPGSGGTFEELLAGIERGLLVQTMAGLHSGVNPTSGDFSVGAEGLLIRNGELAEPVREVTIASTLQRLLLDLCAVGSELERLPGGSTMPPLVIADVALSGS